jgi:hypothetical protein
MDRIGGWAGLEIDRIRQDWRIDRNRQDRQE